MNAPVKAQPAPLPLAEVAAFVARSGASLHVSFREGRFLVVGHVAATHACTDASSKDLGHALRVAMVDLEP